MRVVKIVVVMSLLIASADLAAGQSTPAVLSKYVLGASEYNRQLEQEKLTAADDTEVAGWIVGYKAEAAKMMFALTFFKDGTVVLSMYGSDTPATKYKVVGLDVFLFDEASQQYSDMAIGSFGKDRKSFTMVQGTILDKQ